MDTLINIFIMQRFIFVEKQFAEHCACTPFIYMDFFLKLQDLLILDTYKYHI